MDFIRDPTGSLGSYFGRTRYLRSSSSHGMAIVTGWVPPGEIGAIKLLRDSGTFTSGSATLYAIPRIV